MCYNEKRKIDIFEVEQMILKFEPIALEKVWGGNNLKKTYGFTIDKIGEVWGISGHVSYSNKVVNGEFKGMTLRELYKDKKDLFGYFKEDEFPVLVKVIDADDDLSVQVHPQDDYALRHESSRGKDECWYILGTNSENTEIVIGHNAKTHDELVSLINKNDYDKLLNKFLIKANDYFYIPSGKIHAICKDTTLLEVSQSSNITYRLFDYNRLDNGKLRDLHIKQSIDVINVPDTPLEKVHNEKYFAFDIREDSSCKDLKADVYGDYLYIISGKGHLGDLDIYPGDFYMISSNSDYKLSGDIKYAIINLK